MPQQLSCVSLAVSITVLSSERQQDILLATTLLGRMINFDIAGIWVENYTNISYCCLVFVLKLTKTNDSLIFQFRTALHVMGVVV